MSYNYAYRPKVEHPHLSNNIPQMRSGGFQTPFFFGGSQVPVNLALPPTVYNGSSGSGLHKGKGSLINKMRHKARVMPFMK